MKNKYIATLFTFFFMSLSINSVFSQSPDDGIYYYKGYILSFDHRWESYFVATKYEKYEKLSLKNFRTRFKKENYWTGFMYPYVPDSLDIYLQKCVTHFKKDTLKYSEYVLIMPAEIIYTGQPILNLKKSLKKPNSSEKKEEKRHQYYENNKLADMYLYLKNGSNKYFSYDREYWRREIIDTKILGVPIEADK